MAIFFIVMSVTVQGIGWALQLQGEIEEETNVGYQLAGLGFSLLALGMVLLGKG